MPVLDRPNSDLQRLRTLRAAKAKALVTDPADLAFSAATLAELDVQLPLFETEMAERGTALAAQATASEAADPARAAMSQWASHFIQVFNLAVERGEYPASARAFYQLPVDGSKLPPLRTDAERIQWGKNIATGEANRVAAGGAAMANPSAAQVATRYTALTTALGALSPAKDAYDKELEDVAAMRPAIDDLIADIWDEVLFTYRKDDAPSQRRKAREYGITYRTSPGEQPSPSEYSLQGTANDVFTGAALPDVEVLIVETGMTVLTLADGTFLMPLNPAGKYTVRASKAGYVTEDMPDIDIVAGEVKTLNITLKQEA